MYAVFSTANEYVQLRTKAEMTSQWIPPNIKVCLTFWYNMPTDKADLEVYKRYTAKTPPDQLIWKQGHIVSNGWKEASLLLHSNKTYQVLSSIQFSYICM